MNIFNNKEITNKLKLLFENSDRQPTLQVFDDPYDQKLDDESPWVEGDLVIVQSKYKPNEYELLLWEYEPVKRKNGWNLLGIGSKEQLESEANQLLNNTLTEARKSKKKTLRVFEAFAGIGAQARALQEAGINYTVVGTAEIDKDAIKAYQTVHGDVENYGDISKIDAKSFPQVDLLTYSFPCTDLSSAGKRKGMEKGSGTRSGLLWEIDRIVKEAKPPYLLMENVKNILFKNNLDSFNDWKQSLEKYGYENHVLSLNSKDFGSAQSRPRVFMVSIRKDLNKSFNFSHNPQTLTFGKVREQNPSQEYALPDWLLKYVDLENNKGRVKIIDDNDTTNTLTTKMQRYNNGGVVRDKNFPNGVRYITPLEAMRLMGFKDEDYKKLVDAGMTKHKIYKLMGNSIVVNVLVAIFAQMFPEYIG